MVENVTHSYILVQNLLQGSDLTFKGIGDWISAGDWWFRSADVVTTWGG
jgi:hypothetical protein